MRESGKGGLLSSKEIPRIRSGRAFVRARAGRAARVCTIRTGWRVRKFAAATARCGPCRGTKLSKYSATGWRAASKAGKDRVAFFGAPQWSDLQKIAHEFVGAHNSSRAIFYEAINNEPARAAAKTLFGRRDLPAYRIDQAEVLISFGADFLETWQSPVEFARQYSLFRTPQKRRGALTIGRATYVGPRLSMTASKCDDWIATAPGAQADVAWSVLNVLVKTGKVSQRLGLRSRGARQGGRKFRSGCDQRAHRRAGRDDHASWARRSARPTEHSRSRAPTIRRRILRR